MRIKRTCQLNLARKKTTVGTLQTSLGMSSSTRMQSWSPPRRRKDSGMKEVSRETCLLACVTSILRSSISTACTRHRRQTHKTNWKLGCSCVVSHFRNIEDTIRVDLMESSNGFRLDTITVAAKVFSTWEQTSTLTWQVAIATLAWALVSANLILKSNISAGGCCCCWSSADASCWLVSSRLTSCQHKRPNRDSAVGARTCHQRRAKQEARGKLPAGER